MQSYSPSMAHSRIQNNPNAYAYANNSYPSSPQPRFISPNYHGSSINQVLSPIKREGDVQRGPINMQQINLKQNVSFARNYKARLYGADPQEQLNKQRVQQQYRIQLKQQIEEDRRRRDQRIAKDKAEDEKLQRKFYQNIQIEAQSKPGKKEEPSYFVMRSSKGKRAKLPKRKVDDNLDQSVLVNNFIENSRLVTKNEEAAQMEKKAIATVKNIVKRGGYHNKSSLDNQGANQGQQQSDKLRLSSHLPNRQGMNSLSDEYMIEINYEQQRISRLMMSQQNMLRKLDIFKKEIMETNKTLQLDQQLEKVRFKLRAKPLNMQKVYSLNPRDGLDDMILNNSEFYHLPLIAKNHKIYEGQRENKKTRDKQIKLVEEQAIHSETQQPRELVQLHDKVSINDKDASINDKNIVNPEQGEHEQ